MTAADRPSVTDNARAEALQRWPSINIVERLSGRSQTHRERTLQREAFTDGADWAAGRAEAMARELLVQTLTANPDEAASESSWEWARRIVGRLLDAGRAETTTDCGGCRGLGKHSPRCHTQPGYLWQRRADRAESLADEIGANDTGIANRLYAVAGECRARAETTTATDEDAPTGEVLIDDTDWVSWRDLPRYAAKQKRAAEDAQREAKMHYLAREELEGLVATARTRPTELLPAESIALTVALAKVQRGDEPDPNTAAMCVLALARLAGRHDWTEADR